MIGRCSVLIVARFNAVCFILRCAGIPPPSVLLNAPASTDHSAPLLQNFAWSLFDYGGESSWPAVWSFYGVMDYAGFAKPSYHWYRSWWGIEAGHADALSRVFFFPEWTLPANQVGKAVRVVVYAAGASVRAFLNGVALGIAPTSMPQLGYVSWPDIDYAPGNLTVVSYAADGAVLGAYTSVTAGAPAALSAVIGEMRVCVRSCV